MKMKHKPIFKFILLPSIIFTCIIIANFLFNILMINQNKNKTIRNIALSNFNKDVASRLWGSMHGGVYVPKTKETKPNPFLSHLPERDISTPSGKQLTLMNPAYMIRQQMEFFYKNYGIKGHITSLNYFRPETAPDKWEIKALKEFEIGIDEVSSNSQIDGKKYFRLMRPLITENSCLKCHSNQGYKVGDIRGGVSIAIPTEKYDEQADKEILTSLGTNSLIWLLGLFFLFIYGKKHIAIEIEKEETQFKIKQINKNLEKEVQIRTAEIFEANQKLLAQIKEKTELQTTLDKTNKIINSSKAVAFVWENKSGWPVDYVTDNVFDLTGYLSEEFISNKIKYSDIIYEKDFERLQKRNEILNEDNSTPLNNTQQVYRILSKENKVIWVEDRTTIIRNKDGRITHFEGIILDITDRKKIEDENQFKTEFERKIASISTYFVNLNLKNISRALSFTAKSFGRFFDSDKSYIVLKDDNNEYIVRAEFVEDETNLFKTEKRKFNLDRYRWLHFALLKGKPILVEDVNKMSSSAENEKKLMDRFEMKSFLAIPIIVNNTLYGFIGFDSKERVGLFSKKYISLFRLLTEVITNLYSRYLSELELTEISNKNKSLISAVEQSADSVVITDKKGNIEYVNSKFTDITGYSTQEAIGQNPRILKSGNTAIKDYKILWDTILSGNVWKGQFKNINKNKETFWEQATISPIKNDEGEITQFLAIKEDITKKILLENQRSLSQKMESIGQLAAGIAHEINTPMQYVGDNANFLADAYSSMSRVFNDFTRFLEDGEEHSQNEIREFYHDKMAEMDLEFIFEEVPGALEQSKTGIERVTKIVKAMKDFAHPGSKEKAFFNLNKGLQNTVVISKNEWKYVATVDMKLDDNLGEILCLQDELNQVFLNMIVNSAHSIGEKTQKSGSQELGKITIQTTKQNDIVIIEISDTGNGIKKENLDRIFDPFFTTKEVGKGTGQGLAIAHDIIVNKHQGKIEVDSTVGKGSTFTIQLPIEGSND